MKIIWNFVKTTLVGGFFFLLPLILTLFLLQKALNTVTKYLSPLVRMMHLETLAGVHTPHLFAILFLLIVGFLAGLIGRTRVGRHFKNRWEQWMENHVPGYIELKKKTEKLEAQKLSGGTKEGAP
jgi:uncharacterized membrane protein